MDSNSSHNSNNNTSAVPEWFTPSHTSTPSGPTKPPKKSKRLGIIIGVSLCVLLGGIGVVLYASRPSSECFNTDNYTKLLGAINMANDDRLSPSDIQPNDLLYTQNVYFTQGSTSSFDVGRAVDPSSLLQSLGSYYKTQVPATSISIVISSSYQGDESLETAQARVEYIKNILTNAGVASSAITTPKPTHVVPDPSAEAADDDSVDGESPVLIRINTTTTCQDIN